MVENEKKAFFKGWRAFSFYKQENPTSLIPVMDGSDTHSALWDIIP